MTHLELEISNPCNERCLHCYRVCQSTKKGFLSADQAKSVLLQAKELGAKQVTVTGGEALLNPDWQKILQTADMMDYRISLFTNGTMMNESVADFLAGLSHLKEVQFSLYALDESIHDRITGLSGSCSKTRAAIGMLRERNIQIFVSCPVMKENKTAVMDVMRWCDDNNVPSCADIFIFGSSDYSKSNLSHRLSWSDLDEFFDLTMQDNGRLSYIWGKSYGKRDLSQIEFYGGASHSLCVSGDGTIYPAIGWYEPLGNIETDRLADVFYHNPFLEKIRSFKAGDFKECLECDSSDFCHFCFSPHITANGGQLGKLDPEYCKYIHYVKQAAQKRDDFLL